MNGVKKAIEGLLLLALLVTGFAARYPLTTANLPVAINPDERIGLGLLHRLHSVGWNPEWFHYPTFYYYLTHVALTPGGFENELQHARVVNLIIGCMLAIATYWLARQMFETPEISIAAAGLTMFSPILVDNASYISTDVLAACLSVLSLGFLARFYGSGRDRDWSVAMMLAGLATSTKYPAAVVLLAYLLSDFRPTGDGRTTDSQQRPASWLDASIPPRILTLGLAGLTALALVAGTAFPFDRVIAIAATGGGINSSIDASDLEFLQSIRTLLWVIGVSLLGLSAWSWRVPSVVAGFCRIRPYAGVALAAATFLLASPFIVVSPREFLYDVGVELKANMMGSEGTQWLAYVQRFLRWESTFVLAFFAVGWVASATRDARTRLLGIYVLLGYLAIGSAHRGYERYLTPLLPVVFVLSAWGIWRISQIAHRRVPHIGIVALVTYASLAAYELSSTFTEVLRPASARDSAYFAFVAADQLRPRTILYSGYGVPSIEWTLAGTHVRELSRASFTRDDRAFRNQLTPHTLIAIDGIAERSLSPLIRNALLQVWVSGNDDAAQYDKLYLYRLNPE
jgi:hypothetical protein